jgi:glutathione S-transferase
MHPSAATPRDILLYDHPLSGSCHKVRMFLSMIGLPYRVELLDVLAGANHTDWFARLNPHRQIPVIVDDGHVVQDSQAILLYFAMRDAPGWFDSSPQGCAAIMEWLSYAAKEVSIGPQMSRLYYLASEDIDIQRSQAMGMKVLKVLECHLEDQSWLCLGRPTIADLAVFPYVALSREGRLPLDDHPAVVAWIDRIAALPGYIAMPGLPEGGQR